jgi:predicted O-methyltransferase YrrM
MRTSYNNINLTYGDLLNSITLVKTPKKIVEIGILDGYSLECFTKNSNKDTQIYAYDLFEDFNGNHSNKNELISKFSDFSNVKIEYGNFYELNNIIETNIDIIHIDIANNGYVFEYAIQNYLPKLSENGILVLEGGSIERDNVEWMNKYNKPLINPVIQKYIKNNLNVQVFGSFPSITIIRK